MRTVKAPEERRDEILDTALRLFTTQGYDKTTVNAILKAIGIAKGTFYYHFSSKEQVLDGIIERFNTQFAEQARVIANDESLPVLQKLAMVMVSFSMDDPSGMQLIDELHKPQNALLHQKMARSIIATLTPILVQIIEQGIAEKLFQNPYPKQTIEMILIYVQAAFDEGVVVMDKRDQQQALSALAYNLAALFHTAPDTFDFLKRAL